MNFIVSFIFVVFGFISPVTGKEEKASLDPKIAKYYAALLKRPESTSLFQKFQASWMLQGGEEDLEQFLKKGASEGEGAAKQIYAYVLLQKGLEQKAIQVLSDAISLPKVRPQVYLDRAKAYFRCQNYDKAMADINKVVELAGGDDALALSAAKLKGKILSRQGKLDEAVAHWLDLAKKNPKDQELAEDVIDILVSDGLSDSALQLAITLKDNTKDPYKKALRTLRIADILSKQGEQDKALKTYETTLELSAAGSWLEREIVGQIQTLFKREENTRGLVQKFLELGAKYPNRMYLERTLAETLVASEQYEEAKKRYLKLLKKAPFNEDLRTAYFSMLKQSGDLQAAIKWIDSIIKRKPEEAQLHLQRADLSFQLNNLDDVLADLENYRKRTEVNPTSAIRYAGLLDKYGFKDRAIEFYKKTVTDYPASIDAATATAQYLFRIGQKEEAAKLWSSMASKVDRNGLVRLLDTLLMNIQEKLAIKLVQDNFEKFKSDFVFLGAAIRVAEAVKDDKLALKYAFNRFNIAKESSEFGQTITTLSRLIISSKKVEENVNMLASKDTLRDEELFLLADLREYLGEREKANETLTDLLKSKTPANLFLLSKLYEKRFQLGKAAACMEALIDLPEQQNSSNLRRLADLYQREENYSSALATLQKWKAVAPKNKQIWLTEAKFLIRENKNKKGSEAALKVLRNALQNFEDDEEILANMAKLNTSVKRYSQAGIIYQKLYDQAENLEQKLSWVKVLAKNAKSQGSIDKLVDEFTRRKKNSPKAIAPLMALAKIYEINFQPEKQKYVLLEAAKLKPNDASLLLQLASLNIASGARSDAIRLVRKAAEIDKTDASQRKLTSLLIKEGNYLEVLERLEKQTGKSDPRFAEKLVVSLMQQNAIEEAQTYLKGKLIKFPEDWRLLLLDALILYEQGKNELAAERAMSLFSVTKNIPNLKLGWANNKQFTSNSFVLISEQIPDEHITFSELLSAATPFEELLKSKLIFNDRPISFSKSNNYQEYVRFLPKNVKALHLIARYTFIKCLLNLEESKAKSFLVKAEAAGFNNPERLYSVLDAKRQNFRGFFNDTLFLKLIKQKPENPFFYNYYILTKINKNDFTLPKTILQKSRELNESTNNRFFQSYLSLFADTELSQREQLDQLFAFIKKDGTISNTEMIMFLERDKSSWGSRTGPQTSNQDLLIFCREFLERINREKVENLETKDADRSVADRAIKNKLVGLLRSKITYETLRGDDYKAIIRLIEPEANIKRRIEDPFQSQSRYYFAIRNPLIENLVTVSPNQISYFLKVGERKGSPLGNVELDRERLKKHLNTFRNPLLKVFASLYCEPNKDVLPILTLAKKDIITKADAHLVHAYILQKNFASPLKFMNQLIQAKKSSTDKNQLKQIDALIIGNINLLGKDNYEKLDSADKQSIRVTVRKLMKEGSLSKSVFRNVSKMIFSEDELTEIDRKNKSPRVVRSKSKDVLMEKLTSAVELKQIEAALVLIEEQLQAELGNRYPRVDKLIKKIKKLRLETPLLQKLNPKDSDSLKKWLFYHQVAGRLGRQNEQNEASAYLASMDNISKRALIPVIMALYLDHRDRALELVRQSFSATKSTSQRSIFNLLNEELNKYQNKPERCILVVEFINQCISESAAYGYRINDESTSLSKMLNVIVRLKGSNTKKDQKDKKEFYKREKAAQGQFLKLSMQCQNIADDAFQAYYKLILESNKFNPETLNLVKDSLIKTSLLKTQPYSYYRSGQLFSSFPKRLEYLAQAVLEAKDDDLIDKVFLEEIQLRNASLYSRLKLFKQNLLASREELNKRIENLEKAEKLSDFYNWAYMLNFNSSKESQLKFVQYFLAFQESIDLNTTNNTTVEIIKQLRKIARLSIKWYYKYDKSEDLKAYLNRQIVQRVLDDVTQDSFVKWVKIINDYRSNKILSEYVIFTILDEMLLNPISFRDGIELAQNYQYPVSLAHVYGRSTFYFNKAAERIGKTEFENLEKAGYLGSPNTLKLTKMPVYQIDRPENKLRYQLVFKNSPSYDYTVGKINRVSNVKTSYDAQYLALLFSLSYSANRNSKTMLDLIQKLEEAAKKDNYGAALFLTMMGRKSFSTFIRVFAPTIQEAPQEHLEALSVIFKLKSSARQKEQLKKVGLDKLFL